MDKKHREQKPKAKGAKGRVLPTIARDATDYFSQEEAKVSIKGIVTGAAVLVALGFMTDIASGWDQNLHSNISTHINQTGADTHTNLPAINTHMNATTAHVNIGAVNTHSSLNAHYNLGAMNQHSSIDSHTNQAASNVHSSAAATNVPGVHANENLTRGNFHNNGGQGKHSAWTAHGNTNESLHTNASGTNAHTNVAALSRHVSTTNHSNTAAANTHTNASVHANTGAQNQHASVNAHGNRALINSHSSVANLNSHAQGTGHFSHGSHASW